MKQEIISKAVTKIQNATGITLEQMQGGSRKQHIIVAKIILVQMLTQEGLLQKDAALLLNLSPGAITNLKGHYQDLLKYDPKFKTLTENIKNNFIMPEPDFIEQNGQKYFRIDLVAAMVGEQVQKHVELFKVENKPPAPIVPPEVEKEVSAGVNAYLEARREGGLGNLGGRALEGMPKREMNPIGSLGGKSV